MYVGSSASSPSLRRYHLGKVPRQVDVEVVPAPSAQEGVPGRSTSTAASVGSGETDSAPASMRPPTPESPKRDGGGQDNEAHRRP